MVDTPMFDALPEAAGAIVRSRLSTVLSGADRSPRYAHLTFEDRTAIIEILRHTKPGLAIAAP
jgi:hypothetical protein